MLGDIRLHDLRDPLSSHYIVSISTYTSRTACNAHIEFMNGNTSAVHQINAINFPDLLDKLKEFISTLEGMGK